MQDTHVIKKIARNTLLVTAASTNQEEKIQQDNTKTEVRA
jgi:hypothetical protein